MRALVTTALGLLAAGPLGVGLAKEPARAKAKKPSKGGGSFAHGCRLQKPQSFLMRRSFVKKRIMDGAKHARALRWLVERYGHADDDVTRAMNAKSAISQAKSVTFMGLPLSVHADIAPALACVEKAIAQSCSGPSSRYTPRAMGGFRGANTYRGAEVSNHLLGIAIDIDPDRNPCCGCVDPWPSHPLCRKRGGEVFTRTALPKCWVREFERYGFDWLGRDELEDTMHFEFLGDPAKIGGGGKHDGRAKQDKRDKRDKRNKRGGK